MNLYNLNNSKDNIKTIKKNIKKICFFEKLLYKNNILAIKRYEKHFVVFECFCAYVCSYLGEAVNRDAYWQHKNKLAQYCCACVFGGGYFAWASWFVCRNP